MCAYNEERTIIQAITEVLDADYPCDMELIVVDDGSTDATSTLLAQVDDPRVTIHHHAENQGKGAALLSAASIACGTHILPFDADLEYSPEDITRVIYPVLKGRCRLSTASGYSDSTRFIILTGMPWAIAFSPDWLTSFSMRISVISTPV